MYVIDINCDVGEGIGNENLIMPYISSCSIACGGHAGSKRTVRKVVDLAIRHNVKIGAHPSFPDKANFGRIPLEMPLKELQKNLEAQIALIVEVLSVKGQRMNHVKPHGALYNLAAIDKAHAKVIVNAVKSTSSDALLYVPFNSVIKEVAKKSGLKIKIEAFADRNYNNDLTLVSRKFENAVITDEDELLNHLLKIIKEKKVRTIDGIEVEINAETFCFHGDNPMAISLLKYASKMLKKNDVKIV